MREGTLRALALAIAFLAGGCTTVRYADRADEAVDLPERYESPSVAPVAAPQVCRSLPARAADPVLLAVFTNNRDLAAAGAQLRRAEALAQSAGASLWPRLDLSVDGSRGTGVFASNSGTGAPAPITVYQGATAASYEIDLWGRLRDDAAAATLDARASAESLADLAITLNAAAADTWLAVQAQRRLVALLQEQREASGKFLELTQLRFALGQAPAQDIGRQRQQLLDIDGQLEAARANEAVLVSELALLAGTTTDGIDIAPVETLAAPPAIPDPGLPASLAGNRPDVRAARRALEAADRRTASAVARRLPSLSLSATLISIEQSLGAVFDDALWTLGAGAGVNLFDGGALSANVEAAEASAEAALAQYAGTLLAALQEVTAALVRNDSQDRIVTNIDAQLEEADKVLVLTREGYTRGQASYLDVLNALLSKQSLERQRVDAERQQYANRIALCRALGLTVGNVEPATLSATVRTTP